MSKQEFKPLGRAKNKKTLTKEEEKKLKALKVIIAFAVLLFTQCIYTYFVETQFVPLNTPKSNELAFDTFSTRIQLEKEITLKVFEHFSANFPPTARGVIRKYFSQFSTPESSPVSTKLIDAQYFDYLSSQLFTSRTDLLDSGLYAIYVGNPDGKPPSTTNRQYDLILKFSDPYGETSKGHDTFLWQISPLQSIINGKTTFEILLPPDLTEKELIYHFYYETTDLQSRPITRTELTTKDLSLKTTAAPLEETPSGTTRVMLTGAYEKPLGKNERILVSLTWPKGFVAIPAKIIPAGDQSTEGHTTEEEGE